ncbi:metallophosphoesterase [uncultured Shimia sp.]|uniref:metallophosphoesterase n=1 Tax=uncultured Shimia sp. TaxID=573152 RepID=UPI00262B561C|nr:metallophosphoesterase [uncultured Shimia sp.]
MKKQLMSVLSGAFACASRDLSPHEAFGAIGDIHGCADLLDLLLERLERDAPAKTIVLVGDYIDRGPDSAGVLARLMAFEAEHPANVICLMGNHEVMCLEFLDAPAETGPGWLRCGGQETLDSFGIEAPETPKDLPDARDQLVAAMGPDMIRWLRARPLFWQSGNVIVSHAGGDPNAPLNPRRGHGLLWGHRDTLKYARRDGNWMVHGHYITSEPGPIKGRIPVDTGAYHSGVLTAALVGEGDVQIMQVKAD